MHKRKRLPAGEAYGESLLGVRTALWIGFFGLRPCPVALAPARGDFERCSGGVLVLEGRERNLLAPGDGVPRHRDDAEQVAHDAPHHPAHGRHDEEGEERDCPAPLLLLGEHPPGQGKHGHQGDANKDRQGDGFQDHHRLAAERKRFQDVPQEFAYITQKKRKSKDLTSLLLILDLLYKLGKLSSGIDVAYGHLFVDERSDELFHAAFCIVFAFYVPNDCSGNIEKCIDIWGAYDAVLRIWGIDAFPKEENVCFLGFVIFPGNGSIFRDIDDRICVDNEQLNGKSKGFSECGLNIFRENLCGLVVVLKDDISGVDVGLYAFKTKGFENRLELFHINFIISPYIDASKERDRDHMGSIISVLAGVRQVRYFT